MKDFLLDLSVVYSFDHTGYVRHKKYFDETLEYPCALSKKALVTGGSDGIGAQVTIKLAEYGANVIFTGRNPEKGHKIQRQYPRSEFIALDMANWEEIDQFVEKIQPLDLVALNAGGMPDTLTYNNQGVEFQCASQLVGHYRLLVRLKQKGKLKPNARVVLVSSGGMYLKSLDLKTLFENKDYDKVATYANVKRAQVTLFEELAKKEEWKNFTLMTMHPGWVETQGVKDALPGFYSFLGKRLRTPYEGADTILWCLLSKKNLDSGGFYFDRKKVSPYIVNYFNPHQAQREELLKKLDDFIKA